MNKQWIEGKLGVVIFAVICLCGACTNPPAQSEAIETQVPMETQVPRDYSDQILAASVQISMTLQPGPADQINQNPDPTQPEAEKVTARGLGTLVEVDSKTWLITHNHWGDELNDMSYVHICDSWNRPLRNMFGYQFKELIEYADDGTLILSVPKGLLTEMTRNSGDTLKAGEIGESQVITSGDFVQVARRSPGLRDSLEVIDATIESLSEFEGLPVFVLHSLNGKQLLVGDSGGGTWYEGKLVGNIWATLMVPQPVSGTDMGTQNPVATDVSYAAVYPGE